MAWSKTVTIQQIAQCAGVSIATVSRMLNRQGNVHPATEEKVRRAMNKLGFVPARGAGVSRQGRYILAALPNMSNPFNSELMRGMRETAIRRGYDVLYYRPGIPLDALPLYTAMLQDGLAAGIILVHTVRDIRELEALCQQYPLVMCSEYCDSAIVPYVTIDDYAAATTVINYLYSTGRRRIALLNSSVQDNNYALLRERAYRNLAVEQGIAINPGWVVHLPEINFDLAVSAATTMLKQALRPDAIFCVSDTFAAAVIKAAAVLGISVPGQLAVVGFDDIDLASMTVPALTTISQPTYQLGAQACNLLLDRMAGMEGVQQHIVLDTELVVRASS